MCLMKLYTYIELNLGNFIEKVLGFTRYTLICIILCSEFVSEKCFENFLIHNVNLSVRLSVCAHPG